MAYLPNISFFLLIRRPRIFTRTDTLFPYMPLCRSFWSHRVLEQEGIESHVVDAASIAASRRRRRAKTDRLDGEVLLRSLLSFKRGDPRVCAMVDRKSTRLNSSH